MKHPSKHTTTQLFLFFMFTTIQVALPQIPKFGFASSLGGSNWDYGKAICTDSQGNIFTSYTYIDTLNFNQQVLATGNNIENIGVIKQDALGNIIWNVVFNGSGFSEITSCKCDANGDLIITGNFNDSLDLDPSANSCMVYSNSITSGFVLKLSNNSSFIFGFKLGGNEDLNINSLALCSNQDFLIVGAFTDTLDLDPSPSNFVLTNNTGLFTGILARYTNSGNLVWARKVTSPNSNTIQRINELQNGEIIASGGYTGSINVDPTISNFTLNNNKGYLAQYASNGQFINAINNGAFCLGISNLKNNAGYYTVGYFIGTTSFPHAQTYSSSTSNGTTDIFVQYFSNGLANSWTNTYGSTGLNRGVSCTTIGDKLFATGDFSGSITFNTSGPNQITLNSKSDNDVYILNIDSTGIVLDAENFGDTLNNICYSMVADTAGSLYLTGAFNGNTDFDTGSSQSILHSYGAGDIYTLKLSNDFTGISHNSAVPNTQVYLNTTPDQLYVLCNNSLIGQKYRIYNLSGQLVKQGVLDETQNKVNLQEFKVGVYIFQSGINSCKFVKE